MSRSKARLAADWFAKLRINAATQAIEHEDVVAVETEVTNVVTTDVAAKLDATDYTASDVLTKLKTVDGAGSGLDADTLDGQHASAFQPAGSYLTGNQTITLTGDVSGSGTTSINVTIADDSHNHSSITSGGSNITSNSATWAKNNGEPNIAGQVFASGTGDARFMIHSGSGKVNVYTDGQYYANEGNYLVWNAGNDGSGSGLDADLLDGLDSTSFLRSNADDSFSGLLISTSRNNGISGTYNSTLTDQIWTMGSAYRNAADGSNFGNLYGLAYKHTNNTTGGTMAGGHQMVWCQNGTGYAAMGSNIWTSGNVTAYSDIRVKTNLEVIPDAVAKVKALTGYTFDRTDVAYDEDGSPLVPIRQTGVVAQEVLAVLPEAVTGTEETHYSVAYGNLVGLLIEAIKEQQTQIDELKAKLEG